MNGKLLTSSCLNIAVYSNAERFLLTFLLSIAALIQTNGIIVGAPTHATMREGIIKWAVTKIEKSNIDIDQEGVVDLGHSENLVATATAAAAIGNPPHAAITSANVLHRIIDVTVLATAAPAVIAAVAKPATDIDTLVNAHLSTHKALNVHRHALAVVVVVVVVTPFLVLATMVYQDVRLIVTAVV